MANQSFTDVSRLILLRCPTATLTLAQSWIQQSWRDLIERRRWSFMLKRGQLVTYDEYKTGTATVTAGTQTVTITTGVVDSAHVGRQFRIGTSQLIVTITDIDAALNTYTIDQSWWPTTQTAQAFSVYQAYLPVPSDFHAFVSIVDPAFAQPVPFDGSVQQIDAMDPQRSASGSPPRSIAYFDYRAGLPRYEMWPHQRTAYVFPMVYESRPVEPFDSGSTVPSLIPTDILLERAMMYCSAWPGSTAANPNPYFNLKLVAFHKGEYEQRLRVLEKQDNEHMQQNVWYQNEQSRQSPMSASWMQSHDLA